MRYSPLASVVALAILFACATAGDPQLDSGLRGQVIRGPVTPVCTEDVPCDQPFAAGFTLERDGKTVATFRSDSEGRFAVRVEPGTYRVIPDSDAPIMMPELQAREVTVEPFEVTEVVLEFDTGIR